MKKQNSSAIENNRLPTEMLVKNIKFLHKASKAIDPNTNKRYSLNSYYENILQIHPNTVANWTNQKRYVAVNNLRSLDTVVKGINIWIQKDESLRKWFPNPLSANHLLELDLVKYTISPQLISQVPFYVEKILGTYLCYYNATPIDSSKNNIQYGILQITEGSGRLGECECCGVFSFNDFNKAKKIHTEISENQVEMETAAHDSVVFKGKAYINHNFIWVNLSNEPKTEFVAFSFDIDPKILEKNPQKSFKGVRGLALSQSSGSHSVSVEFPIAIKKTPITPSKNEIRKHLALPHKKVEENSDQIRELATNLIALFNSFPSMALSDDLRLKLITRLLANGFESILETNINNTCYFSPEQSNTFYHEIITPEDDG